MEENERNGASIAMQEIDYSVKKVNLYEEIAENLETFILTSTKTVGDKLPSEHELAKRFGVSRNIIREALKLLKERGLITVRTGEGAYITMPQSALFTDMLRRVLTLQDIDANTIYEMSLGLEAMAARYASSRANEKDFDVLDELNRKMNDHLDDFAMRVELDVSFHKKIAQFSRNALLEMFVSSMTDLRAGVIQHALQSEGGDRDGVKYHQKIVKALRKRAPDEAEAIMCEHLEESWRRYMQCPKMVPTEMGLTAK